MADEKIEHRNNTRDNPVNWAAHGINTVGLATTKKERTDRPPEDVNPADLPMAQAKLPPQIIEHNDEGTKSTKHSADDENYDNHQLDGLQDGSINSQTPMKVNSETSQDADKQREAEERRNPPGEENAQNKNQANQRQAVPPVAANTRPVATQDPAAVVAPNVQEGANSGAAPVTQQNTPNANPSPVNRPADANLTVR